MQAIWLVALLAVPTLAMVPVSAQENSPWQMQDSGTTAGLRGIDSVDGTVAWASGTGGTVLKTTDGGAHWQKCAVPDAATDGATLDFRGVQAFDANTAIIMSSGKGKLSRLYKTTNGCKTWKLLFANPDKDGFWDALYFDRRHQDPPGKKIPGWLEGWLLGDPVDRRFSLYRTADSGNQWFKQKNAGLGADPRKQGAFAASNSSMIGDYWFPLFGSGGSGGAFVYSMSETKICVDDCSPADMNLNGKEDKWQQQQVPLGRNTDSSGIFSIAGRSQSRQPYRDYYVFVAVGGDYTKPNEPAGTAAWSSDGGEHWTASATPPHGYRSSAQWSDTLKLWITVGTNGSDISRDDGKTWQPLDNGNWNALSLPFVVGPNGRIARLKINELRANPPGNPAP